MKITILYDSWEGREEYPGAGAEGQTRSRKRRPKLDREEIFEALGKLGHEVSYHELDGHDSSLFALSRTKEDLIFNLVESYGGDDGKEASVAAFLDLIGKRYTGSGPNALLLAQNKAVAKKIFRFHDLFTPYFAEIYRGRLFHAQDIRFPLIIKPMLEDGSIGIDNGAVVSSIKELMERIGWIHEEFDSPALLEEYIEGREIYAAVLGNDRPEALPLVELDLSGLPDGAPRIAGWEVKFERGSDAYRKTKSAVAEELPKEVVEQVQQAATTAYQALQLRDYGRIDMRVTAEGKVHVLEANPNPWLSSSAEFMMAARSSGRTFVQTIGEIVELAMGRSK